MADDQTVQITFTGNASQLQATATQVASSLKGVQNSAQQMSAGTVAAGAAVGAVMVKMAGAAVDFAKEALGAFSTVAGEVRRLQATLGGSAEDMSKLRFAADETFVSVDTVARSMQAAAGHIAKNDEAFQALGVSMTDASGNMKSSVVLFGEMADAVNAIENPLERTAAMRAIWGRGAMEMNALISAGSAGIAQYGAEAEKLGLVMSGQDTAAAKQLKMAQDDLNDVLEGLYVTIGRSVIPVLISFHKMLAAVASVVIDAFKGNDMFSKVLRTLAGIMTILVVTMGAYITIVKGVELATWAWSTAQAFLNGVLIANPVGAVVAAIVALIAIVILLIKNFEPVGNVLVIVAEIMGTVLGKEISILITGFRLLADVALTSVDAILSGVGMLANLGDTVAGWFGFDTGLGDKIDAARDAIGSAKSMVDDTLTEWANTAWESGGEIGKNLMQGIVDAIRNLKMPTLGGGASVANLVPGLEDDGAIVGGGGGGKAALSARKQAIMDFFTNLVKSSRDALDAAKAAAIAARDKMRQIGQEISDAIREGFDVTVLSESSGANYSGSSALIAAMKRRLDAVKDFGDNIRKLAALGLPTEMLADIVNAGAEKGAATARMLVASPQSFEELRSLQSEINLASAGFGEFAGQALMGAEVATTSRAAFESQALFRGRLGAAQQIGYEASKEDLAAVSNNYLQEITINATTVASAQDIQAAVAWALATGVGMGMAPAGVRTGGGGSRPATAPPPSTGTISGTRLIAGRT